MTTWDRVRRFFGRLSPARLFGSTRGDLGTRIPAPETLLEKIDQLDEVDRDMIRVAEEALRRGYPEEARVAYWKAARHYRKKAMASKELAVVGAIVRIQPDDIDAWIRRGHAQLELGRRRDAAAAFAEAATRLEVRGDHEAARDALERCREADPSYSSLGAHVSIVRGAPVEPHASVSPHAVDASVAPPEEHVARAEVVHAPRAVRFAIPAQTTTFDEGLPASLQGSEHEAAARDEDAISLVLDPTVPPDSTTGMPSAELHRLLADMKRNPT